jgi:ferritin
MFVLVESLLQNQLTMERTNSAVYRSMADELENQGWCGSAKFMRKSSCEETEHADKIASFLIDRNVTPIYNAIRSIDLVNGRLPDYFKNAYAAEQNTTQAFITLYKQAQDENEYMVAQFLAWFLEEQRISERTVWDIIQKLEATDEWRLIDHGLEHKHSSEQTCSICGVTLK